MSECTPEWAAKTRVQPGTSCGSSLLAIHGIAGGSAYCASKFRVNGLAEAMMQDVRYDGVGVTTVMPGSVATDFGGSAGSNRHESWKLSGIDIAQAVIGIYHYPGHPLVSRVEIRAAQPPRKALTRITFGYLDYWAGFDEALNCGST